VGLFVSASIRFLLVALFFVIFNKCFTLDKWVIREPMLRHVKVIVVPVDIYYQKIILPLPQQQALQKNPILVLQVLQLENLAAERRENTKQPILNMNLLIPLSTASSAHNA
jgi:hypothetical protein